MITRSTTDLPPIGAILTGPHWPDRVRVVRVEPISRMFRREELPQLHVEHQTDQATLSGDAAGFRLAAEATRIRLAYTYDPQFAVSLARIDPLPHQLEAVYYYVLRQPRLPPLPAPQPVPPVTPPTPPATTYRRVTIKTPLDWRQWYDFYQAIIKPLVEAGAEVSLELCIEATGEIDANLVDLSVKESVVQLNPQGKVEVEEGNK